MFTQHISPRIITAKAKEILVTIHKVIAGNLLRARRDRDITQEQLALKIGLSQNWVKKCESGNEKINLDYLFTRS